MNYANIKPWQRSAMLERAVLEKSPAEVSEMFRALGKTEFTARALGLACRYRGLETVKALVNGGAVFEYDLAFVHARFAEFFGVKFSGRYPNPALALIDGKENTAFRHFNWLLEKGIPEDVKTPEILSEAERSEVLEYLCDNSEKVGFKPGEFLFYLYFADDEEMISALKKRGVSLSEKLKTMLTEGSRSEEWSDYCFLTQRLADKDFIRVIKRLIDECGGEKLHFTEYFRHLNEKRFSQPEFFKYLLENYNQSKMNKSKIMKEIIDVDNVERLALCAENGWLKTPKKRDEMIAYAAERESAECTAWLLDFKNRTADFAAEQHKAEKKLERELNAAPNSVTALKQLWSYKKREDGSVMITRYKGTQTKIAVPAKIGKSFVTAIGKEAFSPHHDRAGSNRGFFKTITEVTLPESIVEIGEMAFDECSSLRAVNIPEGVAEIKSHTFGNCFALEKIVIPGSVKAIGDFAFFGCESLKTLVIPEGVECIGRLAVCQCRGLETAELPRSLKSVTEGTSASDSLFYFSTRLKSVIVPRGSFAEQYCKKHGIRYTCKEEL